MTMISRQVGRSKQDALEAGWRREDVIGETTAGGRG